MNSFYKKSSSLGFIPIFVLIILAILGIGAVIFKNTNGNNSQTNSVTQSRISNLDNQAEVKQDNKPQNQPTSTKSNASPITKSVINQTNTSGGQNSVNNTTSSSNQNTIDTTTVNPSVTPAPQPTSTFTSLQSPSPTTTVPNAAITSVSPTDIYLNSYDRSGRLQVNGSGFLSGSNNGSLRIYRSLFLRDYRGVTRYIKDLGTGGEISYPAWTDSYIDTGIFYPAQISDILGRDETGSLRPVDVFIEVYDYTSSGKRTIGVSNSKSIYIH